MSATTPSDAGTLFHAGRLQDAVDAATQATKAAPLDAGRRILLAELLLFTGALERVDALLDACADIDPSLAVHVAEFRQLLRAETARREVFGSGRVPEFLGDATPAQRSALAALVSLGAGDPAEAARLAAQAEQERVAPRGTSDGTPFDDLRDADDILAGTLEVLSTTGKYFWVAAERLDRVEFHKPRRPRDLFWRRASVSVLDGPEGDVYVPATYAGTSTVADEALRLGRATDWREEADGKLTRGVGAVTFLVGEDGAAVTQLGTLEFTPAGS